MKQKKTHVVEISIFHRLFLRFLLCYTAAFAAGWLWCVRISSIPATGNALLFLLRATSAKAQQHHGDHNQCKYAFHNFILLFFLGR